MVVAKEQTLGKRPTGAGAAEGMVAFLRRIDDDKQIVASAMHGGAKLLDCFLQGENYFFCLVSCQRSNVG